MQHQIASRFSLRARKAAVIRACQDTIALPYGSSDPLDTLLCHDYPQCILTLPFKPAWRDVLAVTGSKPIADDCAFFAREYDQGLITDLAEALGVSP